MLYEIGIENQKSMGCTTDRALGFSNARVEDYRLINMPCCWQKEEVENKAVFKAIKRSSLRQKSVSLQGNLL